MASNEAPVSKDHIILTLSVETLTYILTHSASSDQKLNVKSLFSVVENILNRATKIVDKVFLTRHGPGKARQEAGYFNFPWRTEHIDEMASFSSFNLGREKSLTKGFVPPLCAFKDISSELKCKAPTEETALSIFKKLSSYSADEKVVLTLATFALEYGEFCLLANNIQSTDQLAKSMGILRGVPNLLENVEKHREVVDDLNKVIKTTLKVIQCIFDLRNLPNKGKRGFLAEPVYWAIATIVASSTQLCYLISHEEKKQELQPYDHKLKVILTDLTKLKKPETRG